MNNIPIHAPLFPPDMMYGSDDAEAVSVLVEADEAAVRNLLAPTPFAFVSAHAWLEGARPVAGVYAADAFRGALGKVLATLEIDAELGRASRQLTPAAQ